MRASMQGSGGAMPKTPDGSPLDAPRLHLLVGGRRNGSSTMRIRVINSDAAIAPKPFPRPAMGRGRGRAPTLHIAAERLSAQTDCAQDHHQLTTELAKRSQILELIQDCHKWPTAFDAII
jgi:hypothetical protein